MAELLEEEGESWQERASLEEADHSNSQWFFPRDHIESSSPSRHDGIDATKEAYLRKSYCTFLQDLGMRLKVPQVTIATAIVFCHRFFLRQSHAKNDRYVIATVCMFLAGKVEETPKLLQNVICLAYEIRHKKDPDVVQRIKVKEVYEQEKELVLLGERLVLSTLGFDLNIYHPYKPLVAAIKKLKVAQNALAQVAWNFVNDGLRTSLCLQFKAHHIAAGAIFLAAKFLKIKLPSNEGKPWWQEFDVTPRQIEEVSNQMLELYEQTRELHASRSVDPSPTSAAVNHEKRAMPPGTPQVVEKRSAVETKARTVVEPSQKLHYQDDTKTPWADFEQVNIDKLKTAVAKRRKFKAEGGRTRSRLDLTDEEELLERGMENGHKDGQSENSFSVYAHSREWYHHNSHVEGSDSKFTIKTELRNQEEVPEGDLETGPTDHSPENKQWHSHTRDHYHVSQTQRRVETEVEHHQRQKMKDWQEREHKRLRYDHAN